MTGRGAAHRLRTSLAGVLSPRQRKWRRTVASLTLDPDRLTLPAEEPGPRDFIICGSPRTGTSLLAATLFAPPESVVVMEPWDALRLAPHELFSSLRAEMTQTRLLGRGRLDIPALLRDGAVEWINEGGLVTPVDVNDSTLVGVKFPAFWRYLPLLPNTKFLVCLRHPADVIASYAETGGRLRDGLDYEAAFNRRMNSSLLAATEDRMLRRVLMFDYIHQTVATHLTDDNVCVVRYERWFEDPGGLLSEIADFLGLSGAWTEHDRPKLRTPAPKSLSRAERQLVRLHCTTAGVLGYQLDE